MVCEVYYLAIITVVKWKVWLPSWLIASESIIQTNCARDNVSVNQCITSTD